MVTTWMDLEDILLTEKNQIEEDKYTMVPLIYGKTKLTEKEIRFVTRAEGGKIGNWRKVVVKRYKLPLLRKISTGMSCTTNTPIH